MSQEKMVPQPGASRPSQLRGDGLKLIGAGFGRTGTRSLKEALEILGFGPCYHMVEVFEHPEHVPSWNAAIRGEPVDWKKLFQDYQATVDWPGCTFYQQLMVEYPDAKVLLSVRDPEKWYESVSSTIYEVSRRSRSSFAPLLMLLVRFMRPGIAEMIPMINRLIWDGTFQHRFEDKEYALSVFNQHNEEVRNYVPSEKLLVYSVKEGWEPLCTFLGVPVPDVPFPHLNDRENFVGTRVGQMRAGVVRAVSVAVVAIFAFLLLRGVVRRKEGK
jgi:hypothetical protein